jgi:hypothetical protein
MVGSTTRGTLHRVFHRVTRALLLVVSLATVACDERGDAAVPVPRDEPHPDPVPGTFPDALAVSAAIRRVDPRAPLERRPRRRLGELVHW